ncbi:mlo-like protein 5 [Quercus suber]|uniref:MLO-like protein n=1 Tax=Quercus suber TaxID=58331 RepID=A0AAW0MDD2_QUESU
MAGGGEGGGAKELDQTPTWAVAAVCAVLIVISILLEEAIHKIGLWFQKRKKDALVEALEKIKGELMVLGFISLILTFGQTYIARICIPVDISETMLPCPIRGGSNEHEEGGHRRLLWHEHRYLAAESKGPSCKAGYVPLISVNGLHQLHIFIFFLAVFHVIYSAITMTLGRLKIRGWKVWEKEIIHENETLNDPQRFRLTHETSFVRDHTSFWTKTAISFYFVCFWRQFFRSVRRADYLTMRHGFVTAMELVVCRWQAMFCVSILPLLVILAVGTKLQGIISKMALEIKERQSVVQGIPLVQVSDSHFWFGWPQLVLYLIHFVLFQYEFGLRSCFHEDFGLIILRVLLGVGVQFMCSYITLPLYALVTQMGSTMKRSIFDEQTSKALKQWHQKAVKKKTDGKASSPPRALGGSPGDSPVQSPARACSHGQLCAVVPDRSSPEMTANIVASVDLPREQKSTKNDGFHDLLSEP